MSVTYVDEFRRKFCHPRKGETPSMFVFTLVFIQNDVFIKLYLFISRIKQQCTLICEVKTRRKHQKRLKFKSTWKKAFVAGRKNLKMRKIWNFQFFFFHFWAAVIDWVHDVCAEALPENGKATFHYEIVYRRSQFQSPIPMVETASESLFNLRN